MKRNPNCTLCPLHQTAEYVCLLGQGPEPCDVMIIGEAPGQREDDSGKPFVGRAGRLLDELLDEAGLPRRKVFITNAVSCRPPDNRTPKKKEIDACRKWLQYQISLVKPKYILTLGNVPLISLTGEASVTRRRGNPIEKDGLIIFPTFHTSYALRDDSGRIKKTIAEDIRRFKEIVDFGGIVEEEKLNYTIVDSWKKVDQMIDAMQGVISIDAEMTCLYPWDKGAKIVMLGTGTASGEFDVPFHHKDSPWSEDDLEEIVHRMDRAQRNTINVYHNGKFDRLWMKVHYDVDWECDFDTMLAHYMCDENSLHDLEFLAQVYFNAPYWDIPLSEKQGGAPIPKLARYHAHDLYYTRKLYARLREELRKDPMIERVFHKVLMPIAHECMYMELRGCYIDVPRMGDAEKHLRGIMDDCLKKLKKWGDINWGSPKQVGDLLYNKLKIKCPMKTKKGANSTSESALKQIDHPCVTDLLKFRGAKQQLSFFIEGWKPYLVNRRIHPSVKLHGTVTGRPSCEHPNFYQVPRDKLIRSLVTAPKGFVLIERDLSQIELRVVAEVSREPNLRQAFRDGVDVHWLTAMREIERGAGLKDEVTNTARAIVKSKRFNDLYGLHPDKYADAIQILLKVGPDVAAEIDEEWKEYRKKAKAVNFGYVFGMWWKKFKIYARDNYGVELTDKQAQESREAFFAMYGLEKWHRRQQWFAREHGYVRSLSGRKRRLPAARAEEDTFERSEALRQAINSPIQSFANELNFMILLEMCENFPREVYQPLITVYDSIIAEVREDYVERVARKYDEITSRPKLFDAFGINLSVPIIGETKIGPWGSGVSLEKWLAQRER